MKRVVPTAKDKFQRLKFKLESLHDLLGILILLPCIHLFSDKTKNVFLIENTVILHQSYEYLFEIWYQSISSSGCHYINLNQPMQQI